jgi:hypothetical protein
MAVSHHLGYYKNGLIEQFQFLEISRSILLNPYYISLYNPKDRSLTLASGQKFILSKQRLGLLNIYFRGLHESWGQFKVSSLSPSNLP